MNVITFREKTILENGSVINRWVSGDNGVVVAHLRRLLLRIVVHVYLADLRRFAPGLIKVSAKCCIRSVILPYNAAQRILCAGSEGKGLFVLLIYTFFQQFIHRIFCPCFYIAVLKLSSMGHNPK